MTFEEVKRIRRVSLEEGTLQFNLRRSQSKSYIILSSAL